MPVLLRDFSLISVPWFLQCDFTCACSKRSKICLRSRRVWKVLQSRIRRKSLDNRSELVTCPSATAAARWQHRPTRVLRTLCWTMTSWNRYFLRVNAIFAEMQKLIIVVIVLFHEKLFSFMKMK